MSGHTTHTASAALGMLLLALPLLPQAVRDDGWPVRFHDVADRAGLRVPSVYG